MIAWKKIPFEDILMESRDGEWGAGDEKAGHQLCSVIRGTDFVALNSPDPGLPQRWIKDHLVERKKLASLDIIFEMAGGTSTQSTGRSALITNDFFRRNSAIPLLCASFCRHLRLDQKRYSPQFIYYLLQTLYRSGYMAVFNIQHTGVSRFQYTSFKKMTRLDVPSHRIQRKIAAVLSAYDDLIQNNNRRIAILEKMAEELYREWFVRLRFPGHENVKVVKGVPEGWEVKPLPEIAVITYGFPFDGSRFNADGIGKPIIRIRNIPESMTSDYTNEQADDKYIVRRGDLLVGMDGEFHVNHWFSDDAYLVQRSCRIMAKEERLSGYLAKAIYAPVKYYESILQGATVGHLGAKHLNAIKILVPSVKLDISTFNLLIKQKVQLASATNALKQTRDRLLSRLMSGKIDVEKMNILFPESMKEEVVANA